MTRTRRVAKARRVVLTIPADLPLKVENGLRKVCAALGVKMSRPLRLVHPARVLRFSDEPDEKGGERTAQPASVSDR